MPARITVLSGVSRGTDLQIETDALRIGSSTECDLCLPDPKVAPHAVTLEFRDGKYYIYNRTSGTLVVANRPVPSQASVAWPTGTDLQLTRELFLRLLVEGDPRPTPKAAARSKEAVAKDEAATEAAKKNTQLIAVGGIFLLLIVLLLAGGGEDQQDAATASGYETLLKELTDANRRDVADILQEARRAEGRGDTARAKKIYIEIQAELRPKMVVNMGVLTDPNDSKLWRYVSNRMARLE